MSLKLYYRESSRYRIPSRLITSYRRLRSNIQVWHRRGSDPGEISRVKYACPKPQITGQSPISEAVLRFSVKIPIFKIGILTLNLFNTKPHVEAFGPLSNFVTCFRTKLDKMNEAEFVSLCKANSYYCSQKQQTEATKKPSRHPLSPTTPTYVHLLVQSGPHSAAIQISINPFSLEKYPKQIFFSSKYRYTLCCSKAPPDVAVAVREKVQQVSDAQYQPCRWDFSHDEWYVIGHFYYERLTNSYRSVTFDGFCDSTKISKATCWKEARSRLCDYLKSPEIIPKDPLSDKPNTDNSQPLFSANDCRDEAFVNGAATKIRRGLENLTKTSPALPQLSLNDKRSWREKARYYEDYFWDRGNTIGVVLQETRWTNNLLSSCFRLICSDSETRSSDEDSPIVSG